MRQGVGVNLRDAVRMGIRHATRGEFDDPADPGIVVVACNAHDAAVETAGCAVVEHRLPLTEATPLYAASLAKLVTAMCVHRLALEGRLDLEATISTWFPQVDAGDRITVRHLLLHRSGLPEYHAVRLVAGYAVEDRLLPDDVRRLVDSMDVLFEPGTQVSYNNTNYAMLAMIVADVTGLPFRQAADEIVFAPAGMARAFVRDDPGTFVDGMANGYIRDGHTWQRAVHGSTSVGDGGMWWSGHDLLAFGRMLLRSAVAGDGDRDAAIDAMRRQVPLADRSLPTLATGCTVAGDGSWFGGLAEFTGFCAELRVYPQHGVALGAMSNRQDGHLSRLLDSVAERLDIPPPVVPPPPARRPGAPPFGALIGMGGAPWHFRPTSDADGSATDSIAVDVGTLSFHLVASGDGWQVSELPSHSAGWEGDEFVVREGPEERARLREVGGAVPSAAVLAGLTGWWWCPAAGATLRVAENGEGLTLRRGQSAPEPLVPIGDREGRWVLATPWGLLELDHDGDQGRVVMPRAEGLRIRRLVARDVRS